MTLVTTSASNGQHQTVTTRTVTCLFSHKCGPGICHAPTPCRRENPCFTCGLRPALKRHNILLLVDPIRPGDHLRTRMQTFEFDSMLFLMSEHSLKSEPCAIELETAERRGRPLFATLQNGTIPAKYRPRLCLPMTELTTPAGVQKLATAITEHVTIRQLLRVLADTASPPDLTRQTARELTYQDASVLAEHLIDLERIYHQHRDDVTRHWVAWAIEHTGATDAVAVLEQLERIETAPYPAEGIRRALANLKNVIAGAKS